MADNEEFLNSGKIPENPFKDSGMDLFPVTGNAKPVTTSQIENVEENPVVQSQRNAQNIKNNLQNLPALAPDPMHYGKVFSYGSDYTQQNFQRYYQHPKFKQLGFSPWRDNESLYNANSSAWDDFSRAAGQWGNLVWTGLKSGFSSWGDMFSGEATRPDVESAKKFERSMAIGSSTRGGVGGFMTNLFLNSGYTFGVMSELMLEELALATTTALTGGLSAEATIPAMGTRAVSAFERLSAAGKAIKGTWQTFSKLQDINTAKNFYASAKSIGGNVLKTANPLLKTTDYLKGLNKAEDLTEFARRNSFFGSFYRDIREINFALSEGKLEGGMTQLEVDRQLTDEFYNKNGRMPNTEEADQIHHQAVHAGYATSIANLPIIYYSNKLVFENMFKPFKPAGRIPDEILDATGNKILFNKKNAAAGADAFSHVEASLGNTLKSLVKPRTYLRSGLGYFKANLAEGIQESMQEVISGASKKYYIDSFNDPKKAGMDSVMTNVYAAINEQFTSQGLETFASGFLMGGLVQPIQRAPGWIGKGYNKIFNRQDYNKYRAEKSAYINKTVNSLNELYKDPLKFFAPELTNVTAQGNNSEAIAESELNTDLKSFQDLKDESVFSHILTSLRSDSYDIFLKRLEDIKKMDPESIKEAFDLESTEILPKVDQIISRAKNIKSRFDASNSKFINPFKPNQFQKGTTDYENESISWSAFEQARRDSIFYGHSFDRSLERMSSIVNALSSSQELGNVSSTDITSLLDLSSINSDISSLKDEVKLYSSLGGADNRKLLTERSKKLEFLTDYKEKLQEYRDSLIGMDFIKQLRKENPLLADEDVVSKLNKAKDNTLADLHTSYKKYVKFLGKTSDSALFDENIDNSFVSVRDYYELHQDSINLSEAVNVLHNPKDFAEHFRSTNQWMRDTYFNRADIIRKGQEDLMKKKEDEILLNRLYDKGFVIDSDQLSKYLSDGTMPEYLYDTTGRTIIQKDDPKYNEAIAIVEDHTEATTEPKVEPENEVEAPEQLNVAGNVPRNEIQFENLPTDLIQLLHDHPKFGYRIESIQRKKEGDPAIRFEDWVKHSFNADRIILEYEAKKPKPVEKIVKPEPEPAAEEVKLKEEDIEEFESVDELAEVKSKLEGVKSLKQLKDVESEIADQVATGQTSVPAEQLNDLVQAKKAELISNVSIENIQKGDVLLMKDPSFRKAVVISVSEDEIKVRRAGKGEGESSVRVITKDQIKDQVELKYESGMEESLLAKEPTLEDKEIAQKNIEAVEKIESDAERTKEILDDNKTRTQEEIDNDFKNSLGCK